MPSPSSEPGSDRAARTPIALLLASATGVLLSYAACFAGWSDRPATALLMTCSMVAMMIAVMALGTMRRNRRAGLRVPFITIAFLIIGAIAAVLWLPADTAVAPHLIIGIPRRAAIVLIVIGVLPLAAMPIAYAQTFERSTLSEDDLAQMRERARQILEQESP